ncbi:MAG: thioredoxin family protein [Candidatus Methylacidiphilales bacterium]|nr:thioredoxin family protein [Candidatus Methylacidiphilales bacterium]
MKSLASILAAVCVLLVSLASFAHAGEGWIEDFEQAKKLAKEQNKLILADFTGSDWCGWCIKLDKEVFSRPAFQSYVKDKYVLLKLDYPRKSTQSDEIKKQNKELGRTYAIRGYPTVLILDAEGNKKGQLGYVEGGPSKFNAELAKIK